MREKDFVSFRMATYNFDKPVSVLINGPQIAENCTTCLKYMHSWTEGTLANFEIAKLNSEKIFCPIGLFIFIYVTACSHLHYCIVVLNNFLFRINVLVYSVFSFINNCGQCRHQQINLIICLKMVNDSQICSINRTTHTIWQYFAMVTF